MSEESHRIQSRIADYHKWIIERLVGIEGRNESDVINTMISDWIKQNREYLEKLHLSAVHYRAHKPSQPITEKEMEVTN